MSKPAPWIVRGPKLALRIVGAAFATREGFSLRRSIVFGVLAAISACAPPAGAGGDLSGQYDLYSADRPAVRAAGFVISQAGQEISVSDVGRSWAGHGRTDGRYGYYSWHFPDGHDGTGMFTVNPDGTLQVQSVGPGVNDRFLARRISTMASATVPTRTAQLPNQASPGVPASTQTAKSFDSTTLGRARVADQAQNYSEAMSLWMTVIQQGDGISRHIGPYETAADIRDEQSSTRAEAQYKIGYYYEKGLGVSQDYRQAINWYRQATGSNVFFQGVGQAYARLGILYAYGLGTPKDPDKARALFAHHGYEGKLLTDLLDANRLPRHAEEIPAASAQLAAEKKREQAALIGAALSARTPRSQPQSSGSNEPGYFTCHHVMGGAPLLAGMAGCPPW